MRSLEKRCVYCHSLYRPDPRAAAFQKACSDPACRLKRRREAQGKFVQDNPDYFRGRYGRTKTWLVAHPGYLAAYRAAHPDHMARKRLQDRRRRRRLTVSRADIQVTMLRRKFKDLKALRGADIQDTIRLRLDGILDVLGRNPRADIQVHNDVPAPAL